MEKKLSFARIIESQIGALSIELIDAAETKSVSVESHEDLLNILSEINREPSLINHDVITNSLKRVMKSCKLSETCWAWVQIYRRFPVLWENLATDRLIRNRIEHIERICDISEIFATENLRMMDGGIRAAREFLLADLMERAGDTELA